MSSETGLFCGEVYNINRYTNNVYVACINDSGFHANVNSFNKNDSDVKIIFRTCPGCGKTRIIAECFNGQFGDEHEKFNVFPLSDAIDFPDYVPANIREDYKEACSIINLSAKASGTLFRRTLEEIIMDFYEIKDGTLYERLTSLENDSDVDTDIISSLQALRKVGNIGAHLKLDSNQIPKNITEEEARAMRVVIEDLIKDTYVKRHKRQEHIKKITSIAENKSK